MGDENSDVTNSDVTSVTNSENTPSQTFEGKCEEHSSSDNKNSDNSDNSENKEEENDSVATEILNEIENCAAIFQSQQIGDPELTTTDKRKIAEELLHTKPEIFLLKFGEFLKENHLNYLSDKYSTSYEVQYYVKNFRKLLNDHNKNVMKRNRRYEAMKRMEAEGNYFSEAEMEKREPLLYHQMVGQYLSEKEKLQKSRQAQEKVIPTFSNFLIYKMEREEMSEIVKSGQEEEDKIEKIDISSEEETSSKQKRWGEDWDEVKTRKRTSKKTQKVQIKNLSNKERNLLLQEFQSIMKSNFLDGKDTDFNYSEVDFNPEYDCMDIRTQDEEEKYFDEETNDATVCTDTGIEDY